MNYTSEMTLAEVENYIFESGVLRQITLKKMIQVLEIATEGRQYYVFPHLDWRNKAQVLWACYCAFKTPGDCAIGNRMVLVEFLDLLPEDLLRYLHQVHQ